MALDCTISDIMSTHLKTLHPKDTLQRAQQLFDEFDIHHLPVHVMGDIKGIISLGDILFLKGFSQHSFDLFLRDKMMRSTTVDEIMTARPYSINATAKLSEALSLMTSKRVNALTVKSGDSLVGIITSFDILQYFQEKLKS